MFRAATTRVGRFPGLEVTPNQSREKRIDRTAAYDSNQGTADQRVEAHEYAAGRAGAGGN
jgi:hypothetical protein